MRRYLILLFSVYSFSASTQTLKDYWEVKERQIDSLKTALFKADARQRIHILNQLFWQYRTISSDTGWNYLQQMSKEATAIQYNTGMAMVFYNMAFIEAGQSNYLKAKSFVLQALDLAKRSGTDEAINSSYVYLLLMNVHRNLNEYPELLKVAEIAEPIIRKQKGEKHLAILYMLKARGFEALNMTYEQLYSLNESVYLNKKVGDLKATYDALIEMGNVYFNMYEFKSALTYYKQSLNSAVPQFRDFYNGYHKVGNVYMELKQFDSALYYYNTALAIIHQTSKDAKESKKNALGTQIKVGEVYLKMGDFDKALGYFLPFLDFFRKKNDVNKIVQVLPKIGKAYVAKGEYETALAYARELLKLCNLNKTAKAYRYAYDLLAISFEKTHRVDSAYYYLKLATTLRDSIDQGTYKNNLTFYKSMVENKEKESKIELLNKDNQLKQQKLNLLIAGLIGLFVLALVFVSYLNVKRKNERHRHTLAENELKIQQLEIEGKQAFLQHHASELEMQALRSQMNPHFIFNCLNAINHFILNNETETASDYLTKFSRLIRQVLQNSSKKTVPLTDELDTLRLYIELEQVRFKNRFQFSIIGDENIDAEGLMIPPMLLQPFVENAIWHGLMQKETAGELTIDITQRDGKLICIITDNGVGRQKAAASKKILAQKKSMGMEITANRLKMLEGEEQGGNFTVIDLQDEEGNNSGTKVIVTIPAAVAEMVAA